MKKEEVVDIIRKDMSGCYTCSWSCDEQGFNGWFSAEYVDDLLEEENQFGDHNVWCILDDGWELCELGPVTNDDIDIDLPFVISRKQSPDSLKYKYDFTNIFLVFDYERHDPNFSESKILSMQRKLSDAADMGKLYINYPMIESYQHLKSLPDPEYRNRKIPVNLRPGSEYKSLVSKETVISNVVDFPRRINDFAWR